MRRLKDPSEVTVGSELEPLTLCPHLDSPQAHQQSAAPVACAQLRLGLDQPVEEPLVDVVEELGEKLDGEGGIDVGTKQQ